MGMFQVTVAVANPDDPSRRFEEQFWVDTGALYSYVPEARLRAIGVGAGATRTMMVADGRTSVRPFGSALFEIPALKEREPCPVIFAEGDSIYLLGATALEIFGVTVDPLTKTLKPVLSIMAGISAGRVATVE